MQKRAAQAEQEKNTAETLLQEQADENEKLRAKIEAMEKKVATHQEGTQQRKARAKKEVGD